LINESADIQVPHESVVARSVQGIFGRTGKKGTEWNFRDLRMSFSTAKKTPIWQTSPQLSAQSTICHSAVGPEFVGGKPIEKQGSSGSTGMTKNPIVPAMERSRPYRWSGKTLGRYGEAYHDAHFDIWFDEPNARRVRRVREHCKRENLSIHTSNPMKSAKMRFGSFAVAAAAIVPCAAYAMDIKVPSVHVASPHITTTPHLSTPQFKSVTSQGSNVPHQGRFKNDPDNGSNVPPQGRFKNAPDNGSNVPPQGPISNAPGSGSASTQGSITAMGSVSYQGSTR
jgi:hypothetical protein